ncbi:N-acetyltransferase-like protein 2 [Elsinoe australis]|uniref:N-acetyltransferase-like protein 2 n=1 Tax=Elsinoe australis TaxID=40998 RepID=A0A4U7BB28_9PEZI|nr:N-acetyltransferase-like protein 2 [Elsinoe australis]
MCYWCHITLRAATASEPLTLDEEYAMQSSWRNDRDKLTFIICAPLEPPTDSTINSPPSLPQPIRPTIHDSPYHMLGDVNLFLTPDTESQMEPLLPSAPNAPAYIIGELEIMIAVPSARRRGHAKAALRSFILYIKRNLDAILAEYAGPGGAETVLSYLRVKIDGENRGSIALFEGLGFRRLGGVNYFGEVELRRNVEWVGDEGVEGAGGEVRYGEGVNGRVVDGDGDGAHPILGT